jgi:ubiquinone/menaquinone biosynthesis C-methylase UbiE
MADLQNSNELLKVDVFKKMGLEEGMAVGDLGCGNLAYYATGAAKIVGKNGLVYAVDILKTALNAVATRAKNEGLGNLKTIWSNLEVFGATTIPANSLDAIFIHNVMFQSTKHDGFIKEAMRLLKPKGKLMIVDWKKISAPFGPPVDSRPDPEKVKALAAQNGLKLNEEFDAGPYHWGMIFVRG